MLRWAWMWLAVGAAFAGQPTRKPTDVERGRELYQRHCQQCHGVGGRGDGPTSPALVRKPADLQGKVQVNDATLQVVLRGRGAMPAFDQSFGQDDARRTLQYFAALKDPPVAARPAPPPPPAEENGEEPLGEEPAGAAP
jgi:mono/diheme cytochrome c family protein